MLPRIKNDTPFEALNAFRGWLLVFFIIHIPLAFVNFSNGVFMLAVFLKSHTGFLYAVLSLLLCLLLPASLVLLLLRKRLFRIFYAAYCAVTAANYLLEQGFNAATMIFTILFTLPWLAYIFCSRRVEAVLCNGKAPDNNASDSHLSDDADISENQ